MPTFDWTTKIRTAVSTSFADAADAVGTRAKYAGRMAKLTVSANTELENIQKAYNEIGRLYYEHHRGDSDPLLSQLCAEVTEANARIAAMEAEMEALRAGNVPAEESEPLQPFEKSSEK